MSASLAASTVTPGSTAPVESLTLPPIAPCANTAIGRTTIDTSTKAIREIQAVMYPPSTDCVGCHRHVGDGLKTVPLPMLAPQARWRRPQAHLESVSKSRLPVKHRQTPDGPQYVN